MYLKFDAEQIFLTNLQGFDLSHYLTFANIEEWLMIHIS